MAGEIIADGVRAKALHRDLTQGQSYYYTKPTSSHRPLRAFLTILSRLKRLKSRSPKGEPGKVNEGQMLTNLAPISRTSPASHSLLTWMRARKSREGMLCPEL